MKKNERRPGRRTVSTKQTDAYRVEVDEISQSIISECEQLPAEMAGNGVQGGILCTGFLDIEKIIKKFDPPDSSGQQTIRVWFLEKKIPFQTLLLRLPDQVAPVNGECNVFVPRSADFYAANLFEDGVVTAAERSCAIACVQERSSFLTGVLTATIDSMLGCPAVPPANCEGTDLSQACQTRIETLLVDSTPASQVIAAACGQVLQPTMGQMTRQYFANLLNLCLCTTGAEGDIGGVDLGDTVNLNRLDEPLRSAAITVFGTATPTVQTVLAEVEPILAAYCSAGSSDPDSVTVTEVLAAMAQNGSDSIIEQA